MSTSAISPSIPAEAPGLFSGTRWIISRTDDLVWFIGTALVGYLAIGLMSAGFPLPLLTARMIFKED